MVFHVGLSPLAKQQIIPRAALRLILGFVVRDSELLCHMFFPCGYFYPSDQQTGPVLRREDVSHISSVWKILGSVRDDGDKVLTLPPSGGHMEPGAAEFPP